MALQKSIQSPTGVPSSYWMVSKVSINNSTKNAVVHLFGYFDKTTRDNGNKQLDERTYVLHSTFGFVESQDVSFSAHDCFEQYFAVEVLDQDTNPTKQAYLFLKSTSEFADASDI